MKNQPKYTCLICEARLAPDGVEFLTEQISDDMTDMLMEVGSEALLVKAVANERAQEFIEQLASTICLACYLTQGRRSIENAIQTFREEGVAGPQRSALIQLVRVK